MNTKKHLKVETPIKLNKGDLSIKDKTIYPISIKKENKEFLELKIRDNIGMVKKRQ